MCAIKHENGHVWWWWSYYDDGNDDDDDDDNDDDDDDDDDGWEGESRMYFKLTRWKKRKLLTWTKIVPFFFWV